MGKKFVWKGEKAVRRLTALAVAVAATFSLCVPAMAASESLTGDTDYICGLTEHRHDPSCYAFDPIGDLLAANGLSGYSGEVYIVHQHGAGCYDGTGALDCPFDDAAYLAAWSNVELVHMHDANCSGCGLEETKYVIMDAVDVTDDASETEDNHSSFSGYINGGIGSYKDTGPTTGDGMLRLSWHVHGVNCNGDCDLPVVIEGIVDGNATGKLVCGMTEHVHDKECLAGSLTGIVSTIRRALTDVGMMTAMTESRDTVLVGDVPVDISIVSPESNVYNDTWSDTGFSKVWSMTLSTESIEWLTDAAVMGVDVYMPIYGSCDMRDETLSVYSDGAAIASKDFPNSGSEDDFTVDVPLSVEMFTYDSDSGKYVASFDVELAGQMDIYYRDNFVFYLAVQVGGQTVYADPSYMFYCSNRIDSSIAVLRQYFPVYFTQEVDGDDISALVESRGYWKNGYVPGYQQKVCAEDGSFLYYVVWMCERVALPLDTPTRLEVMDLSGPESEWVPAKDIYGDDFKSASNPGSFSNVPGGIYRLVYDLEGEYGNPEAGWLGDVLDGAELAWNHVYASEHFYVPYDNEPFYAMEGVIPSMADQVLQVIRNLPEDDVVYLDPAYAFAHKDSYSDGGDVDYGYMVWSILTDTDELDDLRFHIQSYDITVSSEDTETYYNANSIYTWGGNEYYSAELNGVVDGVASHALYSGDDSIHERSDEDTGYIVEIFSQPSSIRNFDVGSTYGTDVNWSVKVARSDCGLPFEELANLFQAAAELFVDPEYVYDDDGGIVAQVGFSPRPLELDGNIFGIDATESKNAFDDVLDRYFVDVADPMDLGDDIIAVVTVIQDPLAIKRNDDVRWDEGYLNASRYGNTWGDVVYNSYDLDTEDFAPGESGYYEQFWGSFMYNDMTTYYVDQTPEPWDGESKVYLGGIIYGWTPWLEVYERSLSIDVQAVSKLAMDGSVPDGYVEKHDGWSYLIDGALNDEVSVFLMESDGVTPAKDVYGNEITSDDFYVTDTGQLRCDALPGEDYILGLRVPAEYYYTDMLDHFGLPLSLSSDSDTVDWYIPVNTGMSEWTLDAMSGWVWDDDAGDWAYLDFAEQMNGGSYSDSRWSVDMSDDNLYARVLTGETALTNLPASELPKTGGTGIASIMAAGALLMTIGACGVVLTYYRKNDKKRG